MANVGKSPFQILLYELMGYERVYYEMCYNSKKFFHLYDLLYQKQIDKYKIAANSPANIIWAPENLTYPLTPPEYYKDFCLRFYNETAEILHNRGKKYAAHMDGLLKQLVNLIGETKIDIIEAFTPPPMGDLSLREARDMWDDRVIWVNFPGNLLAYADEKTIGEYTIGLLKETAPGDNFILGCTENYPFNGWETAFGAIADVLDEYGAYPVSI
jgi:hypothetical protein